MRDREKILRRYLYKEEKQDLAVLARALQTTEELAESELIIYKQMIHEKADWRGNITKLIGIRLPCDTRGCLGIATEATATYSTTACRFILDTYCPSCLEEKGNS